MSRRPKPSSREVLEDLWRQAAKRQLREDIIRCNPRIVTIGPMQLFHIREIAKELPTRMFSFHIDHNIRDYSWAFDTPEGLKPL